MHAYACMRDVRELRERKEKMSIGWVFVLMGVVGLRRMDHVHTYLSYHHIHTCAAAMLQIIVTGIRTRTTYRLSLKTRTTPPIGRWGGRGKKRRSDHAWMDGWMDVYDQYDDV